MSVLLPKSLCFFFVIIADITNYNYDSCLPCKLTLAVCGTSISNGRNCIEIWGGCHSTRNIPVLTQKNVFFFSQTGVSVLGNPTVSVWTNKLEGKTSSCAYSHLNHRIASTCHLEAIVTTFGFVYSSSFYLLFCACHLFL